LSVGGEVGSLKAEGTPPRPVVGEGTATGLLGAEPFVEGLGGCDGVVDSEAEEGTADCCRLIGGTPCRPRWNAFMRAWISDETFRPLPRFENVGGGRRAALRGPSGVEDEVIPVMTPGVDNERGAM